MSGVLPHKLIDARQFGKKLSANTIEGQASGIVGNGPKDPLAPPRTLQAPGSHHTFNRAASGERLAMHVPPLQGTSDGIHQRARRLINLDVQSLANPHVFERCQAQCFWNEVYRKKARGSVDFINGQAAAVQSDESFLEQIWNGVLGGLNRGVHCPTIRLPRDNICLTIDMSIEAVTSIFRPASIGSFDVDDLTATKLAKRCDFTCTSRDVKKEMRRGVVGKGQASAVYRHTCTNFDVLEQVGRAAK